MVGDMNTGDKIKIIKNWTSSFREVISSSTGLWYGELRFNYDWGFQEIKFTNSYTDKNEMLDNALYVAHHTVWVECNAVS